MNLTRLIILPFVLVFGMGKGSFFSLFLVTALRYN